MRWIVLVSAFFAASVAQGQQFVVVNKMPVKVVNHCPAVVKEVRVPAFTTRAPVGHTHTCANGHTWDHSMTSGHNCPICGLPQYVQDSRPRTVTVRTTATAPARAVQPQYHDVMQLFQSSGGCAGGNCPNTRR